MMQPESKGLSCGETRVVPQVFEPTARLTYVIITINLRLFPANKPPS